MKLSIVVPCFNEEAVIRQFHQEITRVLAGEPYDYELVYVNDGSRDATLSILKELSRMDVRANYISFSKNFGKESGMLAGITYATGDAILIMDADLQHPPSLIPEMVAAYRQGYDQVIARRNRKGDPRGRSVLTAFYYKVINRLIDVKLEDGIGDFRLLSRNAADALLSLQEYNRFSKGLFSWIGFKEYVIDYDNVIREDGGSKWSFGSLLNYGIDGVLSFNNRPLRMAIYLGLTITVFALLYVLVMLFQIVIGGIDVPGYFTTISSVLLLGGIQLFFMGIIGEYIGRIYFETKRRPHFIIEDMKLQDRGSDPRENLTEQ
ncbi:glycosyltransferase family 2 protein [Bhargavaea ginsengi]|uniref:glycosyltransferase family 2 protein n=1 Tax=Bhargavaea ginsengi TaxID=426757 RepID=UPI00203C094B|nr:glycosyltransferase family 2 protein [Bhargavaea ginsengi]MCM3088098.1 glycosyltransferase family 2 protein [Bhargavaea ginsengi]